MPPLSGPEPEAHVVEAAASSATHTLSDEICAPPDDASMVEMSVSLTFCAPYVVASADAEVLEGGVISAVVVWPELVTAMSVMLTAMPAPAIAPKSAALSLDSGRLPERCKGFLEEHFG